MAHSNSFSTTTPEDNNFEGEGYLEIVKAKVDIKERIEVDHCFSNSLDTTVAGADGQHKQVTLVNKASDPTLITGTSILYSKSDGLYFRNSAGIVKII